MLLAAISMTGLLASCGGGLSVPNDGPELRTTYVAPNGEYVACQALYNPATGTTTTQNVAVVQFYAANFTSATVQLRGSLGSIKAVQFTPDTLRKASNGYDYLADLTISGQGNDLVPLSVGAQAIITNPAYSSVTPAGAPVGRFDALVTVSNGSTEMSAASTNSVNVYSSCTYNGSLPSRD